MDKNKCKIAVIGVGYWGQNLARVFYQLGALRVICDTDPDRLKQIGKDYPEVITTLSYTDILNDKYIKAVVIASPAESHHRMAKDALLAKKDVFVEKPMATKVEQGMELVELADKYKRILMVGHILEFHPGIAKLKELINRGELGNINYIYSNRLNLGKVRREENILWSFAPHDISAILLLLNETPESISVHGGSFLHHEVADVTVSSLNFSSGIKGHIFVSWLHPYKDQKLVIVGDKKMAVFDDVAEKDKLLIFNHKVSWSNGVPVYTKEDAERIEFKMEEPLLLEAGHFLDCLRTRAKPKTDGKSALRVLRVLEACQRSLEQGGTAMPIGQVIREQRQLNNYYSHPTSVIEQPCSIGKGTKVWHYSHIMKGAKIGKGCTIGQNVFIGSKASIGNGVKLQNNISIYDCVKLEDDVFCGPSVVFTNVVNPRGHICRKREFKPTLIKKGATLGANATIICANTIGEYAFIGAGAVVTKDIPDFALAYGNPAEIKGWVCVCANKLNFTKDLARCSACGVRYIRRKGCIERA